MDWGTLFLLFAVFSILLFILQRTEPKKRFIVFVISLVACELLRRYVWYRDLHTESWIALIAALLFTTAFWLFIGRYNPVKSSDEIQVIGMDD